MSRFHIESWAAIAPGLETRDEWQQWLRDPLPIEAALGKPDLSAIPAMQRRRFSTLGKCAMGATLQLIGDDERIPAIFASRHGDTLLSLSLLEGIARGDPMSPTSFSLAVHNAISGLYSIARKDTSAITAIATMDGLVLQTLFEAIGQLQTCERLLCVIYDIPLPEFYQSTRDEADEPFPYAIALLLSKSSGEKLQLEPLRDDTVTEDAEGNPLLEFDAVRLLRLLAGIENRIEFRQARNAWQLSREPA